MPRILLPRILLEVTADSTPAAVDCWYLTGPTAAGKTHVGIELARRIGAEIVSLDSMAVYREMDIGTAKPSAAQRQAVPHHLIDVVPPTEDFSLSEYVDAAHAAIVDIRGRGHEVLFVGGTPLYLKALLRGVYQGPPADWEFRAAIERDLQSVPLAALHQRLQVVDPLLAAKLHPNDKRRIVRGLEVFKTTGQRLSHLQTQFDEAQQAEAVNVFVLSWPREALQRRIDARVESMFASGFVAEVEGLLARYGTLSRTAIQAVGYREVVEKLGGGSGLGARGAGDRGQGTGDRKKSEVGGQRAEESWADCVERVKVRTRQFAKRQETWFRSLSECTSVTMEEDFEPGVVAEKILSAVKGA
ncbi:MAG TPA: tRNA (adenosine(37)-N6)-dimethylallyltransferase MiaA [Pirellulaceae bacterium]|jgi:tRNA dimethylallyltransferase